MFADLLKTIMRRPINNVKPESDMGLLVVLHIILPKKPGLNAYEKVDRI